MGILCRHAHNLLLLLPVFVQPAYFSKDDSKLGQVHQNAPKEEHCWCMIFLQADGLPVAQPTLISCINYMYFTITSIFGATVTAAATATTSCRRGWPVIDGGSRSAVGVATRVAGASHAMFRGASLTREQCGAYAWNADSRVMCGRWSRR